MLHKSIRWRIQAWHTLLLVGLVTGMLAAFYQYERAERFRMIDNQLQALLTPLLPKLMPPHRPDFDGGPPPPDREDGPQSQTVFAEFENGPFYYAAWRPNHELIGQSSTAETLGIPMPTQADAVRGQFFRARSGVRELVYHGPDGSTVVVGSTTDKVAYQLNRLALALVGVGFGITFFGLVGGWFIAGYALRPIGEISATAQQIADGNRARRIDIQDTESELGRLAEVLNRTFDRQDGLLEQQVRFTADASHELRTPVSVILTQTQLALSRERGAAEYRESLQACQRAAERMRGLVNSLLDLARVDSGKLDLTLAECDLATVAAESLELVVPLALEKNAILRSAVEPIRVKADSARIGQVLVNLLYNAVQHNPNGVEVRLVTQKRGNEALLRVEDNGAGIPADALPHIFERFYRVDQSRTRNGNGLGLSICQAIVQAHRGTIRAESQAGKGTAFIVSLPLAD
jgi:heavy metal sensor kinase